MLGAVLLADSLVSSDELKQLNRVESFTLFVEDSVISSHLWL
jgi:hypothetical protein